MIIAFRRNGEIPPLSQSGRNKVTRGFAVLTAFKANSITSVRLIFVTINVGNVCICRVPKSKLEEGKLVQCKHCGCRGCCSGD